MSNKRNLRLLVCGGRDYNDRDKVFEVLDLIHRVRTIAEIISGAARGADSLAAEWARSRGVKLTEKPADWKKHGRRAGPLRNLEMLDENPDGVVAFPGGKGTQHMIEISKKKGVPVWQPLSKK